MRRSLFILMIVVFTAGCATRSDMQLAQQDMDELKNRIFAVEKNTAAVTAEAKEIAEINSREALKNLETLRKGTADMQANLDAMRIDVQVMAGRVEDLMLAAKKPFEDLTLLQEDTSKTVVAMEERLKKLEAAVAESNTSIAALSKVQSLPPNAEISYKQAYDTLKGGETGKAREMFTAFAAQFPEHRLQPNARYWIGETYYIEKNYEQAIVEFQRVIKEYPGKEKVPAAMLKQALSFREIGDTKSAKFVLKEMLDKYPHAEEIATAKEMLNKLK